LPENSRFHPTTTNSPKKTTKTENREKTNKKPTGNIHAEKTPPKQKPQRTKTAKKPKPESTPQIHKTEKPELAIRQ